MLKRIYKWLSKKSNQKGSTLTITLAVIAVISASAVAVTGLTINLAGQTNSQINSVNDEATGKALITEMINEFQAYVDAQAQTSGYSPSISDVTFQEVTSQFPDFGTSTSQVFKFSYLLSNGNTLYKYAYVSSTGSSANTDTPLEFQLATEGDLILNSGYYEDSKIYADNIYVSDQAVWEEDDVVYEYAGIYEDYRITPSSSTYPTFSGGNDPSELYYKTSYKYCNGNCFTVTEDMSSPFVLKTAIYNDVEGSQLADQGVVSDVTITDFFTDFTFGDFVIDMVTNTMPTNGTSINGSISSYSVENVEAFVRANMGAPFRNNGRSDRPYSEVTNFNRYTPWSNNETIRYSYAYDGDLLISNDHTVTDYENEGLVVLGNLTINNTDTRDDLYLRGTYLVTGNLEIIGDDIDINRAAFIVLGQTYIDLSYGGEIETQGNNYELTILSGDTIFFEGNAEDYLLSDPVTFTGFLYSETSIWIDCVESKMSFEGSIYARASEDTNYPIPMIDDEGNQVHGIVINSYKGYTNAYTVWDWDEWAYVKDVDYVPGTQDADNRFVLFGIDSNQYSNNFLFPPQFSNVVVENGNFTIFVSEFKKEE